ncbi:MAG: transposase [Verrucomicrobia bacterium]|nr:transposase [Verrucomicrobiota bacterium]
MQWDKQGKHIPSHRNYELKNKSIFEHPDPQKLVNDFAGKGRRVGGVHPGTSGYQEIVDFGEFIGYAVDFDTGARTATTWGKIHYAKDGVHIVPSQPRW